jgi:uncharacterized repeat protein (TIGR01451 family)
MRGKVKKLLTWLLVTLMVFGSCVTGISAEATWKEIDLSYQVVIDGKKNIAKFDDIRGDFKEEFTYAEFLFDPKVNEVTEDWAAGTLAVTLKAAKDRVGVTETITANGSYVLFQSEYLKFEVKYAEQEDGKWLFTVRALGSSHGLSHFQFKPVRDPALPDLSIVKTASPTAVEPGDEVTYTIEVTNNGADATELELVDVLPAYLDFVEEGSDDWDHEENSKEYEHLIEELASGDTVTITFKTVVSKDIKEETEIPNTAKVNCEEDDDWKQSTATITVVPPEEPEFPTLTVKKVLVGGDGETRVVNNDKEFTINILSDNVEVKSVDLQGGEEEGFEFEPGEYVIEEEPVDAPYSFVGAYIGDDKLEDGVFTIEDDTTITVINKMDAGQEGTITIRKVVQELTTADGWVNVDDDTDFFVNVYNQPEGEPINSNPIKIKAVDDGEVIIGNLSYGTYYVVEVAPTTGYTIYDGDDDEYYDTVTLSSENPSATATIVNRISSVPEEKGNVTIIKELEDENGELITSSELSFKIKLTDFNGRELVYDVPVGVQYQTSLLSLGAYTVEEVDIPEGYELVSISDESFNLTREGFTVTVRNKKLKEDPPPTDAKGTIIVKKVILNSDESTNTEETREFIVRVKNTKTNSYEDFTLKKGALEKSGQFNLGEYEISEIDVPSDYDVYISDEDRIVDLEEDGDIVTVTVTNIKNDTPAKPTISKDDGGVRVYPGDTITYDISVDIKDNDFNGAYLIESPDPNTEYIPGEGDEWEYMGIVAGRKTYKYDIYQYVPMFARSEFSAIPEIPEFKVSVKNTAEDSVINYVTLYYEYESEEHVTAQEDTPILERDDDDKDDDDKDDDKKDDPPKVGKPDLVVDKTDNDAMVSPGALVEYVITVENNGDAPAEDVRVYETVPAGTEFAAASNTGWVLEEGRYVYDLGLMNVGDKKEVKFVLKVNDPFPTNLDKILNEVEVKDNGTETATNDNKASDDTPVLIANILIEEPPVIVPSTPPVIPEQDTLIVEPAPQAVPDLPFTGGVAALELLAMSLGISMAAAGIILKRK